MKSVLLRLLALLVGLGLSVSPRAQSVHVVDPTGAGGAPFTTISAAVAAARDGDLVLVNAGIYPETVTLDGKGIIVQAEKGAAVWVDGIVIRNLAAVQFGMLHRLRWMTSSCDVALRIEDNRGVVWVEDCGPEGGTNWWGTEVHDSDTVLLLNGNLGGPAQVACNFLSSGCGMTKVGPGLCVVNSEVALYGCRIVGGRIAGASAQPGPPGIALRGSKVTLYDSTATGGEGAHDFGIGPTRGGPGADVAAGSSLETISGAGKPALEGGRGGAIFGGGFGPQGAAFSLETGSRLHQLREAPRQLRADSLVRAGSRIELTFTGLAGDNVFLLVSDSPGPLIGLERGIGPAAVPPSSSLVHVGRLGASGTTTRTFSIPQPIGLLRSLYVQAVFLPMTPVVHMGAPTQIHVLDIGVR